MYELKQLRKKNNKVSLYNFSMKRRDGLKSNIIQACGGRPVLAPNPAGLEYTASRQSTTCIITYDNRFRNVEMQFESGGGYHAEEKAIAHLKSEVDAGNILPGMVQVVFSVSKSPCSSNPAHQTRKDGKTGCQEQLEVLQNTPYKGVTFVIEIIPTKPYQPRFRGGKAASLSAAQNSSLSYFPYVRK